MTGPSLPWVLSDMSTQISPNRLNWGSFRLTASVGPRHLYRPVKFGPGIHKTLAYIDNLLSRITGIIG
jgi:hypothetical protein